jgi:hypothetical protein
MTPSTGPCAAAPEIPHRDQLTDAHTTLTCALGLRSQARAIVTAAHDAYTAARDTDPAGQDTDQARHAWTEALHDLADARAAVEQARDELTAIERQARP